MRDNLGPHLADRPDVAAFPRRLGTAEYALLHLRYVGGPSSGLSIRTTPTLFHVDSGELLQRGSDLIVSPQWRVLAVKDGFNLFGRGLPARVGREQALQMLESDAQHFRETFGHALRFRSSWARFLVSTLSWKQLLAGRERHNLLWNK